MITGVGAYADDVRTRRYPAPEHGYKLPAAVLAEIRSQLGKG